jgi:hypothetical protein
MARAGLEFLNTYSDECKESRAVVRLERSAAPASVTPTFTHLEAAVAWIQRAQQATKTGGVAWGYRTRRPIRTNLPMGWIGPYPETTGYIIPTMFRYADVHGDKSAAESAMQMLEWELSIQLADGGFQGGIYGAEPVASSTFVTGQVLFGLVDALERLGDRRIRTAGIRAGDWLLSCLDENGRFVRGYSHFCLAGPKCYEVRTGLALAELGEVVGEKKYHAAADRIADYALSLQRPNGWFAQNDLDFHDRPLTHTIGYTLEGLHGLSKCLGRQDCLKAVDRTLDVIAGHIQLSGFLPGRLREDWSPAVNWACLTGSSQIAGVFVRRYIENKKREYLEAGKKLLGLVCFTQELAPGIPGIDGGIRGSYPFGGEYGQWCVLNWATKFFCDSVMDYVEAEKAVPARPSAAP